MSQHSLEHYTECEGSLIQSSFWNQFTGLSHYTQWKKQSLQATVTRPSVQLVWPKIAQPSILIQPRVTQPSMQLIEVSRFVKHPDLFLVLILLRYHTLPFWYKGLKIRSLSLEGYTSFRERLYHVLHRNESLFFWYASVILKIWSKSSHIAVPCSKADYVRGIRGGDRRSGGRANGPLSNAPLH